MSELKPCPCCGSPVIMGAPNMHGKTHVLCPNCFLESAWGTPEEVAAKWNRRAQPANEPLTLDELRGMEGEPVWVADNRSGSSAWMQYAYEEAAYDLIAFWEFGSEVESAYCALDYGKTWLAYRRKPETKGV